MLTKNQKIQAEALNYQNEMAPILNPSVRGMGKNGWWQIFIKRIFYDRSVKWIDVGGRERNPSGFKNIFTL